MIWRFKDGTATASNRVNRGGSWNNNPRNVRSANRNRNSPGNRNNNLGFRLLRMRLCQEGTVQGWCPCAQGFIQRSHPVPG